MFDVEGVEAAECDGEARLRLCDPGGCFIVEDSMSVGGFYFVYESGIEGKKWGYEGEF